MQFLPTSAGCLHLCEFIYVAILYFPVLLLPIFSFNDSPRHTLKRPWSAFYFNGMKGLAWQCKQCKVLHGTLSSVAITAAILSTVLVSALGPRQMTRHRLSRQGWRASGPESWRADPAGNHHRHFPAGGVPRIGMQLSLINRHPSGIY